MSFLSIFEKDGLIMVLNHVNPLVLIVEHVKGGWEIRLVGNSLRRIVDLGAKNLCTGSVHM